MSVPPSSNPPGGFPIPPQGGPPPGCTAYYGQPPGRPANNNGGCFKAFGITCLTLLVLGIIGVVALFPIVRGAFQTGRQVVADGRNGQEIRRAIVAYHIRNNKYPSSLTALVSDGEVTDPAVFHNDPDPPGRISWHYTVPPNGAPGNTPILDLPYNITIAGHTQPAHLVINLDGSTPNPSGTAPPAPSGSGLEGKI